MDPRTTANTSLPPQEPILWTGSPERFPVFRREDAFLTPFSVMWGGFAMFWEHGAITESAPTFVVLWGLAFVLVGVYLAIGRLVLRWIRLRGTHYTVTTHRIIVNSEVLGIPSERSRYLRHLDPPVLKELAGGLGTITFGSISSVMSTYWGAHHPIELHAISNAHHVRDLIASAQRKAG